MEVVCESSHIDKMVGPKCQSIPQSMYAQTVCRKISSLYLSNREHIYVLLVVLLPYLKMSCFFKKKNKKNDMFQDEDILLYKEHVLACSTQNL